MSDQDPSPWVAAGALLGGLIAWLWKQLRDALQGWKTSVTEDEKAFRERVQKDIDEVKTGITYLVEQSHSQDKRIGILEDRANRSAAGEQGA